MRVLLLWIGARARWVLAAGALGAVFLPGLSEALRPAVPALVALVLGLAVARIDLPSLGREALRPRRLAVLLAMTLVMMPVTAGIYWALGRAFGLSPEMMACLVLLAAAPPISSSASLSFLMGFNARLALEVSVFATLVTPLVGVLTVELWLGARPGIEALPLALRLFGMIGAGMALGILIRRGVGAARLARNGQILDGIVAVTMFVFILPLFDGVGALVLENPGLAAGILGLATLANLGTGALSGTLAGRVLPAADAGALGMMAGNRTIAAYFAALPPDPVFGTFVALYQIPMLMTPILLQAWQRRPRRRR